MYATSQNSSTRQGDTMPCGGDTGDFGDAGWMDPGTSSYSDMEDRRMRDERVSSGLNAHVKKPQSTGPIEVYSEAELAAMIEKKTLPTSPFVGPDDEDSNAMSKRHKGKRSMLQSGYSLRSHSIAIFDKKGDLLDVVTGECTDETWGILTEFFGTCQLEHGGPWHLACPLDWYVERKKWYGPIARGFTPGPCLFNSTAEYMKAILGKRLHATDRTYFDNHPLTVAEGTPMPYTARIAQEIVEPYGLRVCKIRVNKGYPVKDDLADWMEYLGCNPIAVENSYFTNAEFAELTGQSVADVDRQYGFEFNDQPLRPSVICEAQRSNHFTSGTGHASYFPPRGKSNTWWISLQIDASPWPNTKRPVYEPYVLQEAYEVDFYGIRRGVEAHQRAEEEKARRGGQPAGFLPASTATTPSAGVAVG